jgi:hypothetical protein
MWTGAAGLIAVSVVLAVPGLARGEKEYDVRIVSEPEGAEIRVDDPDADPVGKTPWDGTLPAGPYMLILDLEGHQQLIEEIVVEKKRKRQTFELELTEIATGTIEVVGGEAADGATIAVDGNELGTVPATLDVAEGPHQVVITKDGYKPFERWIEVSSAEPTEIDVVLEPAGGTVPPDRGGKTKPAPPRTEPLVVAGAALELGWRRWDYDNPRTESARPFDADAVPLLRIDVEFMPLAAESAYKRGAGVRGEAALGLPPDASTTADTTIDTSWSELELGVFYRAPIVGGAGLRADVAFGRVAFGFGDAGVFANEVPEVDYRFIRLGASADYRNGKLQAAVGGALLSVLDVGGIPKRFRESSSSGFSLEAGASYRVMDELQAGLSAGYRRYLHDLVSMSGDPIEADGSTDIYFGVMAGAAYLY